MTGTEQYSRAMNQAAKLSAAARQQFDRQVEEFLKTVHLPSKANVARIHDRLAAIEEAIEQLRLAIGKNSGPAAVPVTRTRKPPEPK